MLGWSIRASACRSASKRAITCRVSIPALMTLTATWRLDRLGLLGHEDHAHAALADLLEQLVRPDRPCRAAPSCWTRSGSRRTPWRERLAVQETAGVRGRRSRSSTSRRSAASPPHACVEVRVPARPGRHLPSGVQEDRSRA